MITTIIAMTQTTAVVTNSIVEGGMGFAITHAWVQTPVFGI